MRPITGVAACLGAAVFLIITCSKDNPSGPVGVIPAETRVLIISNNANDNQDLLDSFPAHLSGFTFTAVDLDVTVPALAELSQYDVVLLHKNGTLSSDSTGDRLYEYVMQGGGLVLGTFYWTGRSDGGTVTSGWGRLETIDPIFADSGNVYAYDTLGTWIDHPLTRGLDTICSHHGGGYDSLRADAVAVAWWKNGEVFMAYNMPGGRIVGVTMFPAEPGSYTTGKYNGFYRAWENALLYAAWGDTRQ